MDTLSRFADYSKPFESIFSALFTHFLNCAAGVAYPFLPYNLLEMRDLFENSAGAFEDAARTNEAAAEALKGAYQRGMGKRKMQREVQQLLRKSQGFDKAAKALDGFGYALVVKDAYKNYNACDGSPSGGVVE